LSVPNVITDNADFVNRVCSQDESADITEAIAGLPERCRKVATRHLLRGIDYKGIARTGDFRAGYPDANGP
jgi:DNA-directed RNA polymerase specialized sigma24 family protein